MANTQYYGIVTFVQYYKNASVPIYNVSAQNDMVKCRRKPGWHEIKKCENSCGSGSGALLQSYIELWV